MIETKHLNLVVAIGQYGSLNKASKALNLTQSALSHQLKTFEEYLGVALFERTGNQLYFTEAGQELKKRGELIIRELNNLERKILEIKEHQLQRYIHGYSEKEAQRLKDQAKSIAEYLHFDSQWQPGTRILEVGCGVGAQTAIIAEKNEQCQFVAIDISQESLDKAKHRMDELGLKNIEFKLQDLSKVNRKTDGWYDHVFACFILEHLSNPREVLRHLKSVVKPGGTITVIEGDHDSTFFYPENAYARKVINAQVQLQTKKGGNANIGREIYPLLKETGFRMIEVSPRQIYVDHSKPALVKGFILDTFTAMMEGVAEEILKTGLLSKSEYELGIAGLKRTAEIDGVFSYTFFKGTAIA